MLNVHLHSDDGVVLDVRRLRGEMVSRVAGEPPVFDDQRSYVLRVQTADIAMDMPSLTNLMNRHVFAYEHSPLSDVTMELDEGRLKLKAKLHKGGVPVPISMKADVAATPDGRLRLKTENVSALGVPAMKLMTLFGLDLDKVVNLKGRGVDIDDNDVLIAPGLVLPPPEIQGRLTHVEIAGGRLVQTFGSSAAPPRRLLQPDRKDPNYVYFSGSDIRFGKLTMTGADLELIDADPKDPFDFFPARYDRQLVAGYSKNTPSGGLRTYMPDYADLDRVRDLRPPSRGIIATPH